tara:strand:- start:326 stop:544 length:219 start_codon:yes stop_codon:yes gene_type:complete
MADETEKKDSRDWRNNINFRNKDIDKFLDIQKKNKEKYDEWKKKKDDDKPASPPNVGLKTLGTTTKVPRAKK